MNALTLDSAPLDRSFRIVAIDWAQLSPSEARRLRELGLFEGIEVIARHRGSLFTRDPLAVQIGRMQIIIRSRHAQRIAVESCDGDCEVPIDG